MLESRLGLRIVLGCKFDKIFLTYGTYGVHGASSALGAHGRLRVTPLATNCWPRAPGGEGGGRGSWRPRTRGVAPPCMKRPEIGGRF